MWHGWADAAGCGDVFDWLLRSRDEVHGRSQADRKFLPIVSRSRSKYITAEEVQVLTDFDALTALENWVENGEPPEKMIACRSVNAAGPHFSGRAFWGQHRFRTKP